MFPEFIAAIIAKWLSHKQHVAVLPRNPHAKLVYPPRCLTAPLSLVDAVTLPAMADVAAACSTEAPQQPAVDQRVDQPVERLADQPVEQPADRLAIPVVAPVAT